MNVTKRGLGFSLGLSLLLGSSFHLWAQAPTRVWDKTLGGSKADRSKAIVATGDGGHIIVGESDSPASGDKSQNVYQTNFTDYWIVRVDANGNKVWDKRFGSTFIERAFSVTKTSDGHYVAVGFVTNYSTPLAQDDFDGVGGGMSGTGDCWVLKFDGNGNKIWDRALGGMAEDVGRSVAPGPDGSVVVLCTSGSGPIVFPEIGISDKTEAPRGNLDYWVVKLDASGGIVWQKTLGGSGEEQARELIATSDGGFLVGGDSKSNISGEKTSNSRGFNDYWVVKLDANGTILWDKTYGTSGEEFLGGMTETTDGFYVLGGFTNAAAVNGDRTAPTTDAFGQPLNPNWFVKLNAADGSKVWDKVPGAAGFGAGQAKVSKMIPGENGSIVAAGFVSASGANTPWKAYLRGFESGDFFDYWALSLNGAGDLLWNRRMGGTDTDDPQSAGAFGIPPIGIAPAGSNTYVLTGPSVSGIGGDKTEANRGVGFDDYWLFKFNGNDLNNAPTAPQQFTMLSIADNTPNGTVISNINGSDPDGDGITYIIRGGSLPNVQNYFSVNASGQLIVSDNSGLDINGMNPFFLSIDIIDDHESNLVFSLGYQITLTAGPVGNQAPTDISLSAVSIPENSAVFAVIGTLSSTDPDAGDSHTYSLVSGAGDAGNSLFSISGNQLRTNEVFDFEAQSTYSIRVRTTDQGSLAFEKVFTITITDVVEGNGIISISSVNLPTSANESSTIQLYELAVTLSGTVTYPITVFIDAVGTAIRQQAAGPDSPCSSKITRDYSVVPSASTGPASLTWSSKLTPRTRPVIVRINGDNCAEPDEWFKVFVYTPTNSAAIGTGSFQHTILNDDAPRLGADGEAETLTTGLTLYPNPTQGALTLQFQASVEGVERLQVLDVAGRVVHTQAVNAVEGRNEVALDLSAQPAGVYFVQALGQTAKVVLAK
jgi:hypothetical protein